MKTALRADADCPALAAAFQAVSAGGKFTGMVLPHRGPTHFAGDSVRVADISDESTRARM